jgi:hypothetical protein
VEAPLLAGKMAALLATRYAALLNSWDGAPDPEFEKKLRVLRSLNRDLALLQRTLQQANRHETEYFQQFEDDREKHTEKMKELALRPIQAMLERSSMQGMFEMYVPRLEAGRLAELATAIKFNLPLPKKARKAPSGQTRSNHIPSTPSTQEDPSGQTQSNPVKPSQTIADCGLRIADSRQDDPSGQTESDPHGTNGTNGTPERDPAGQTQSNPVKPGQSENGGLTVKPECADGRLQTAT